jgi:hypothetical protein
MSLISNMSSIDNSLEGGGSASASGKKGAIQLSDGNFNLTSNKELQSDPKTGTITTTGLTTTGTVYAATISTSNLIADTVTDLTVIGDASITGNATVDGFVQAATISSTGNMYISSNLGIGTTDTAEYKFLVKNGSNNLFGVPYDTTGLADGKTIVYNGSGWVYDNAGPADGTQIGEILAWDGSEWSANSTVVVEGTSVGIGSTQPTQKLDVVGNVKATDFIGSGDALSDLNASNVTSGTIDNARLPGTISVSNLEATANLVVGGPADITGTLSTAGLTSSQNITVTGNNTLSASNLRTSNLYVTGPMDITGTLSASSITSSGNAEIGNVIVTYLVEAATVSSTGSLTGASATVSGQVQGATISSTGQVVATGSLTGASATVSGQVQGATISSTGSLTGASATVTGQVQGATISSTGSLTGASATVSGQVQGATISSTGSLTGASATVTGQVQGSTISSTEHIIATGTVTGSTVNTPMLYVTKDAQITGNLIVSGGVVTITTTTTGTSNLVITNAGTGPVLVATQLGPQPIANFIDGRSDGSNVSALFISGGEQTGRDGYVGLGTETPTHRLDVQGDANVATNLFVHGTLSTSNVETSNLTVTNSHNVIGTLSASNVETSNLTVTNLNTVTNDAFIGGTLSASNVDTSNLTVTNLNTVTNDAFIGGTLSASNVNTSNLTVTNLNTVTNDAFIGGTLSASNVETSNLTVTNSHNVIGTLSASNVETSNLTVTNLNTVTNDAFIGGTLSASNVETSNLTVNGNTYISSNLGIGTSDTAEYKLLVKDGSSNLFGVPYNTTGLADGKTIVYDGSGWVYDNAGPADGTQTGEILAWDGSEWSANSAVVVEGTNVGIGSTQPVEKLNVSGNVRVTQNMIIGDSYHGRAMRLNDTPASNLYYQPNFTITGSLTSAGDIKTNQSFRGHNMFLSNAMTISGGVVTNTGTGDASVNGSLTVQGDTVLNGTTSATQLNVAGTITTSNITHGSKITVTSDLLMGPGATLTASNIVGASPVTISSNLVMASGFTLTAAAIEPPSGAESNLNITGTITASNITHGTELTLTSNLLMGSDKTLTTSNVEASNLTVSNRLSGGTISVSNIEATANLVVGGPVDITGTLSALNFIGSGDGINVLNASNITSGTLNNNRLPGTISVSNIEATANLVVGGPVDITGTLSAAGITSSAAVNVTGTISASGALEAAKDSNTTSFLGRAAVGYNSGDNDWATFAHIDHNNTTGYAVAQTNNGGTVINRPTGTNLSFRENDVPQVMLLSGGNLGINKTSPAANVHMSGGNGDFRMYLQADENDSGESDNPRIVFIQDGNYYEGSIGMGNNQLELRSAASGTNGISFWVLGSSADTQGEETGLDNASKIMEILNTGANVTGTVSASGAIRGVDIIGTSTVKINGASASGNLVVKGNATTAFVIQRNGVAWTTTMGMTNSTGHLRVINNSNGVQLSKDATSWSAISDERFKKNITILENNLDVISNIRCVSFNYKHEDDSMQKRIGFIAQDWLKVLPEIVDLNYADEEDGVEETYLLRPVDAIPVLCGAIKELLTKVETLEARIEALENSS